MFSPVKVIVALIVLLFPLIFAGTALAFGLRWVVKHTSSSKDSVLPSVLLPFYVSQEG